MTWHFRNEKLSGQACDRRLLLPQDTNNLRTKDILLGTNWHAMHACPEANPAVGLGLTILLVHSSAP